jgi:hypothetical protein
MMSETPSQEVVEPLIDIVNVEGGDFHKSLSILPYALPKGPTGVVVPACVILPLKRNEQTGPKR